MPSVVSYINNPTQDKDPTMPRLKSIGTTKLTAATLSVPSVALAHVSITPNQSMAGATEKYVGAGADRMQGRDDGADLEVPEGVIVEVVRTPAGWKYEVKRENDRIVSISWPVLSRGARRTSIP